jgi:hypothetical protein
VLQACKHVHTIVLLTRDGTKTAADVAAIAEHGHKLHSLMLDEPTAEMIDAMAPRLPQIEHLALVSGSSRLVLPIDRLSGRCSHLRSLMLTTMRDLPESKLIALLSGMPLLEELVAKSLLGSCLTDNILCALGKLCPHLRRLRLSLHCMDPIDPAVESFHALAQGCRALEAVECDNVVGPIARAVGIPVRDFTCPRWQGAYENAGYW